MKAGGRILVVDDNDDFRTLLREVLVSKGYSILEAVDGQQAMEVMTQAEIHLGIVDLDMPRMNGIEFSKKIKAERPNFPIIMVTAYSQFYSAGDILGSGVDAFLQKPVDLERLLKAIEQL
jgi:CheY-like chemotaxis protein